MIAWLEVCGGLVGLYFGAEILVKGGVALALRLGLTPLVIGLTVMAYGTSSPELVVSAQAAWQNNGAIAVGNVLGSNICNLALILGICALVLPLRTESQVIRREVPLMIAASITAAIMLWDRHLGRVEGIILLLALATYTVLTVRKAKDEGANPTSEELDTAAAGRLGLGAALGAIGGGLVVLMISAHFFVGGAVTIATAWGMSTVVIGLTVVAVGTSMPELATSLVAALKGQNDVAVGNVVGSSVFNLLGILGFTATLRPIDLPELAHADIAAMVLVAVATWPILRSGNQVCRLEGAGLLLAYIGYTTWLIMRATA